MSDTIPVTLEAAEKLPILQRPVRVPGELVRQLSQVHQAVAILADGHHVRDRLAPWQLVAVVLERPDEHDRSLVRRDPRPEVPAVVEVGRDAQLEYVDQSVDRARRSRATEDHGMSRGVTTDPVEHEPARLLAEARGLEARPRRLGVGVRVQRQDGVADVVLDERQASPGRRVVRVRDPADPVRSCDGLVVADHGRPDQVDQRVGARLGRSRPGQFRGCGVDGRLHVRSSLLDGRQRAAPCGGVVPAIVVIRAATRRPHDGRYGIRTFARSSKR